MTVYVTTGTPEDSPDLATSEDRGQDAAVERCPSSVPAAAAADLATGRSPALDGRRSPGGGVQGTPPRGVARGGSADPAPGRPPTPGPGPASASPSAGEHRLTGGARDEDPGGETTAGTSPAEDPEGSAPPTPALPSGQDPPWAVPDETAPSGPAARGGSIVRLNLVAAAMSEDELEEKIRGACQQLGILRFHVRISRGTTAGLPDDILIGPRGILWRECKRQGGKPTAAQARAGEALTAIGQDFSIWRPEDWLSGRIAAELTAISGMGRTPPGDAA